MRGEFTQAEAFFAVFVAGCAVFLYGFYIERAWRRRDPAELNRAQLAWQQASRWVTPYIWRMGLLAAAVGAVGGVISALTSD